MLDPKGNLVTLVGFDPSGNIVPLQVDANGYIRANAEASGAGAGTMLDPKGNLVTPVGYDPTGNILPVQMTAEGFLRVVIENPPDGGYTEGARVYNDANIVTVSGTSKLLTFNQERYDTDEIHSTITDTGRLVCKTAGKYSFYGCVLWAANAVGIRSHQVILNGSDVIARQDFQAVSAAGYGTGSIIAGVYDLAVNDYLTFIVYQSSGSNINILVGAKYTPEFMMQRIG